MVGVKVIHEVRQSEERQHTSGIGLTQSLLGRGGPEAVIVSRGWCNGSGTVTAPTLHVDAKLSRMTDEVGADSPGEPDVDENGVDLTQIRQMLDLPPMERLMLIQSIVDSVVEIRSLNDPRSIR
jgi:hypothetical protein